VPLLLLLALIPLVLLVGVGLMPLMLVQRYRVGTARQVPNAVVYTLAGLGVGCLLGAIGLAISRWEVTPASVHYTPNRWLVLGLTLVISSRLIYGMWRSWHAWQTRVDDTSWIAASGAAGSLAAGAVVVGYYLAYWIGLRWRIGRYRRLTSPATRTRRTRWR
jgi:hypothetical protein